MCVAYSPFAPNHTRSSNCAVTVCVVPVKQSDDRELRSAEVETLNTIGYTCDGNAHVALAGLLECIAVNKRLGSSL